MQIEAFESSQFLVSPIKPNYATCVLQIRINIDGAPTRKLMMEHSARKSLSISGGMRVLMQNGPERRDSFFMLA